MKLSICVIWVDRKKYFWLWCNHSQLLVKDNIKSKKMTFLSLGGYLLSLFCFNGLSDILDNWIDQHLLDCLPVNYVDGCRWQHVKPLAARLRVLLRIKATIRVIKGFGFVSFPSLWTVVATKSIPFWDQKIWLWVLHNGYCKKLVYTFCQESKLC